jgi:NifU-like protein involved in Fe-S cluster formation
MSDYIDRGQRRARAAAPPVNAPECRDDEGRFARFGVQLTDGFVAAVGFRASPCVTLIAYCEAAAERVAGRSLAAAIRALQPADLALALPSVPPVKRDCARLAARALTTALVHVSGAPRS